MNVQLRLKNRLLPVLVVILLVVYLVDPYRGWLVMLTGLGAMLAFGFFWVFTLRHNLELVHERRYGWASVGDRLEERFVLKNHGWLPAVWVDVDYRTTMPGYLPGRAIGAPAGGELTWVTSGICTRRGVFTLGPLLVRSGDPLGIFEVTFDSPAPRTLLVTPPVLPLPPVSIAPGGRAGESRIRQHAFETSISVSTVREYLPGDSIRMIHWPTTARKNDFFVRILENTPAGDWWIFLDLDARHRYGEGSFSTEEHGVVLAASLAEAGLQRGNAVGLVTQGDGITWLPPHFGEVHHQKIMQALALAKSGELTLAEMLSQARPAFRQNPSLILVSSNLSTDWVAEMLPLIKRRIIPTVLLFDPARYPSGPSTKSSLQALFGHLELQGVSHSLMDPDYFDRPDAQPGRQGRWVWRHTTAGTAVADAVPDNLPWQKV